MKRYCSNCFYPLPYKAKFCAHCGQKDSDGKVTMGFLLRKLWTTTLHLEGKFFRTAAQLFVPGLMTKEYFKGKQERYPHPMRFFIITMFFFVFALNLEPGKETSKTKNAIFSYNPEDKEKGDTVSLDGGALYKRLEHYTVLDEFNRDYEAMPAEWRTPEARMMFDSLIRRYARRNVAGFGDKRDDGLRTLLDTIDINLINRQIRLPASDVVRYQPDEIIERYAISGWVDKMAVRQGIKSIKNPEALMHAYIGSLTWTLLAQMAVMAAFMGLLYRRQHRYYVEHFLFLLHFHTGALLAFLPVIAAIKFKLTGNGPAAVLTLVSAVMMYFAMRRYYEQGALITLVKWLIYNILYVFSFAILFIAGLLVVFAVF